MRSSFSLLLAGVTVAAPTIHAQRPGGAQPKVGIPVNSPVSSYTVEISTFAMTPPQPRAGDNVTFQLTLRNTGSTTASVPWLIGLQGGSQMVGQGTVTNLTAGATQTVTATWRAVAGGQAALGTVSPPGTNTTLNTAPVSARAKDLLFSVASVSASTVGGSPATTEVRLIDFDRVRVAGGSFADGRSGACLTVLKPVTYAAVAPNGGAHLGEVYASLDCRTLPTGARMNPVVFDRFTLKNGWRVKSFDVIPAQGWCPNGNNWQVAASPSLGSDTPRTQLAMWANANCGVSVFVKLQIEGPRGTDPYQ